jgi:hypothetical protein
MLLGGFRGAEAEIAPLIEAAQAAGQGLAVQWTQWVAAILYNGLGRYETALAAAQGAEQGADPHVSMWAMTELIEAAIRTGRSQLAAEALGRLAEATSIGQTDWGQGIYARSRALLSDGEDAERCYREAIGRLSRTGFRPELARAQLLYGEWLRRERRRTDARTQLRTAHDMFAAIGMQAFAERARRELRATGETARRRTASPHEQLTPQEAQIARLARPRNRGAYRVLARERVVDFQVSRRAVDRDGHAVGGQERVVVDDRVAGRGEADPVAEQGGTGLGAGKIAGVTRAERGRGYGLVGPGDGQPLLGQDGVETTQPEVLPADGRSQRGREVGSLDDQRPAAR